MPSPKSRKGRRIIARHFNGGKKKPPRTIKPRGGDGKLPLISTEIFHVYFCVDSIRKEHSMITPHIQTLIEHIGTLSENEQEMIARDIEEILQDAEDKADAERSLLKDGRITVENFILKNE